MQLDMRDKRALITGSSAGIGGLLTRAGSSMLRERVDALHKPLRAVIVTHGHPDHYGGVAQLVAGREGVPVFAIEGVDAVIRRDDALKGRLLSAFGIDWADPRTFPNVVLAGVCGRSHWRLARRATALGGDARSGRTAPSGTRRPWRPGDAGNASGVSREVQGGSL